VPSKDRPRQRLVLAVLLAKRQLSSECPRPVFSLTDRHFTELRKGLQQQDARCRPHCPGDEVTRPHHLTSDIESGRINENIRIGDDHHR
jgi:hypothetical protein